MKGLAFRRLFGVGGSDGGPAGAAGARSAHTARAGAFGPRPCGGFAGLGPAKRRRPGVAARPSCAPRPPHIADGCRLGMGEAGAVGYAPGRRRLAAGGGPQGCPRPAKQKSAPGALGPGCALSGRFAPRRRPPGRWDFAPPPRRGRQGGKPGRSAGLGMADVGPGLSGLLQFCQAVFLWQKEQHPDFLGNKAQIYKLRLCRAEKS